MNEKTLSAMDVLAPTTMKNAAKCDTSCESQNPVSHQNFERSLHFRKGVCLLECLFIQPQESLLDGVHRFKLCLKRVKMNVNHLVFPRSLFQSYWSKTWRQVQHVDYSSKDGQVCMVKLNRSDLQSVKITRWI